MQHGASDEEIAARSLAAMAWEMKTRAHVIDENRRRFDLLYNLITNRDTLDRRRMVVGIQRVIEARFKRELENAADPSFRQTVTTFFDNCSRKDRVGNVMQMYCIYVCMLLDLDIRKHFLPPAPNPDTDDHDPAPVCRVPFTIFLQKYLMPLSAMLRDGSSLGGGDDEKPLTVPVYCQELDGMYAALTPNDPLLEQQIASGSRNQRRVDLLPLPPLQNLP